MSEQILPYMLFVMDAGARADFEKIAKTLCVNTTLFYVPGETINLGDKEITVELGTIAIKAVATGHQLQLLNDMLTSRTMN